MLPAFHIVYHLDLKRNIMALYAEVERNDVHHVILEEYCEGVYVLVFATADESSPSQDHLQNDMAMAKRACEQDFHITESMWKTIPDTGIMGERDWKSEGGAYRDNETG